MVPLIAASLGVIGGLEVLGRRRSARFVLHRVVLWRFRDDQTCIVLQMSLCEEQHAILGWSETQGARTLSNQLIGAAGEPIGAGPALRRVLPAHNRCQ